jgi:3-hydroxyisobutyrate dehydrogenase
MATKELIGFIGLGNMGWPMAGNLVRSGHNVIAYDIDLTRTRAFAREFKTGALGALADLQPCPIIITMLPTGAVVREALTAGGKTSLAASLNPGTLIIDTTSAAPADTRALGKILAERQIALVDASVSGATIGAKERRLVFMMGADEESAMVRAESVLSHLGSKLFRMGPLGAGNAMKALNNFMSAAGFVAACEAVVVGERYGLDPSVMVEVLNVSTGRNFTTEHTLKRIADRSFDEPAALGLFTLGLFTKDIKIAAEMAESERIAAPLHHLVYERMAAALATLGGDVDHALAHTYWERAMVEAD